MTGKGTPKTLPPGCPVWVTPDLLAETVDVWQPYHAAALTDEEALAILLRMGGVLALLVE